MARTPLAAFFNRPKKQGVREGFNTDTPGLGLDLVQQSGIQIQGAKHFRQPGTIGSINVQ
ncbi:MAG: hypothetical protein NPIRA03_19720 [Nitrospirales bacterium]|nr:MAG: hypothetical protein NPIRA03_19720 [Nitrospirales bacterium]